MSLILNGTDGLSDVDGTAATPAIRGTDANTGIFFPAADTIAFSEGGTESMRIDSSGNVGIKTTSPNATITIGANANDNALSGTSNTQGLHLYHRQFGISQIDSLVGGSSNSGMSLRTYNNGTYTEFIANTQGNTTTFQTGGTERMRIDSGGRLLLNQTANNGTALLQMICPVSTDGILIQIGTNGTNAMSFLNAGGAANVGSIAVNLASTAYNTSSDYRLKENIAPMTGALATISALKPVTYTWKADGSDGQGFIAHELQEVVPDAVTGEKDAVETYIDKDGNEQTRIKAQGIDTSFLVATLTAAIQELKAELDSIKAELATLKAQP
jgi:hypothetical protein